MPVALGDTMGLMAPSEPIPFPVAARELLRNTLLDAAHELLRDRSWPEVTMAEIAVAAGVSRQTLYNEFGTRREFAQAYVLREGDRFINTVEGAIHANLDDPTVALRTAFDIFLTAASEDPLIRAIIAGNGADELLPLITTQGQPLIERAAERLADIIVGGWSQVGYGDALLLAECLVRLAISHATMPAGPAGMDGAAVTELLGPYLERVLAGS
jgi:AcrR family transcriptional regulator